MPKHLNNATKTTEPMATVNLNIFFQIVVGITCLLFIASTALTVTIHVDITDFCRSYGPVYVFDVEGNVYNKDNTLVKSARTCHYAIASYVCSGIGFLLTAISLIVYCSCRKSIELKQNVRSLIM